MLIICVDVGLFGGINKFELMVDECIKMSVKKINVIIRYEIKMYDMRNGGGSGGRVWEKRGKVE
jgi:hypothetical protein